MATPLATIIKMFARPRFVDAGTDTLETTIPVLRLAGSHSGEIQAPAEIDSENAHVGFCWAAQIYRLVPAVTRIRYDTSAARVAVHFDPTRSDAPAVSRALDRLVAVGIDTIGSFLVCDKKTLRGMATRFAGRLEREPIDLTQEGSEEKLRKVVVAELRQNHAQG